MNQDLLVPLIRDKVKGTTFVSIDYECDPRLKKTGNPYRNCKVVKRNTMTGVIGFDYQSSVNRQAAREGKEDRLAKSRKWGVLTPDRIFVEHKDNFYLQMKVESSSTPTYHVLGDDGIEREIPKKEIEAFIPEKSTSSTQEDLNREVILRDVAISNIRRIRMMGVALTDEAIRQRLFAKQEKLESVESVESVDA